MSRPLLGAGPDPRTIARPWIGSYPPGVPPTYRYPDVLLTRFLDDAVRDFPDVVAVQGPEAALTYHELGDVVDRLAGALEGLGVGPQHPLGLLLDRGLAYVVGCFAAWRLGAVVVPVDPVNPDPEVHRRLAHVGVRVLLTRPSEIDRVRSIRGALPDLRRTVVTLDTDWLPRLRRVLYRLRPRRGAGTRRLTTRDDVLSLADIVDTSPPRSAQRHADVADTAAVLFDDDGRALAFGHHHLVAAAFQSRLWVPDVQAGHERVLVAAPSDGPHALVAGLLDPVLSAATIVTVRSGDADAVAERIEDTHPTLLRGSADLFGKLAATSADLTSIRASLTVAGSLDTDTVERFAVVTGGARLRRAHGPVSACGLTHANPVYGRASATAIGLPVSDTLACVVDAEDPTHVVAVGDEGRLLVRGPQVTFDAWPVSGDTSAEQPLPTWWDTGHRASVDAHGWFTLTSEPTTTAQVGGEDSAAGGTIGADGRVGDDEDAT